MLARDRRQPDKLDLKTVTQRLQVGSTSWRQRRSDVELLDLSQGTLHQCDANDVKCSQTHACGCLLALISNTWRMLANIRYCAPSTNKNFPAWAEKV